MKKKFRIVKTDSELFPYRIEQRHTILCFIHWWSTPEFAPPHIFYNPDEAVRQIEDSCKNYEINEVWKNG